MAETFISQECPRDPGKCKRRRKRRDHPEPFTEEQRGPRGCACRTGGDAAVPNPARRGILQNHPGGGIRENIAASTDGWGSEITGRYLSTLVDEAVIADKTATMRSQYRSLAAALAAVLKARRIRCPVLCANGARGNKSGHWPEHLSLTQRL